MERTNRDAPTTVAVVGRPLHCYACGYDPFWQRSAQLNTALATAERRAYFVWLLHEAEPHARRLRANASNQIHSEVLNKAFAGANRKRPDELLQVEPLGRTEHHFCILNELADLRMVDRFGTQRMTISGLVGIAVGAAVLAMLSARFGLVGYLAPIAVMTASYALFQAANNTVIMMGIRPEQRGVISGMLSLSRNLGLITGASVMGAVFAVASATTEITMAHHEAVASGMRITFAAAAILIAVALAIAAGSRALSRRAVPAHSQQSYSRGLK
jgi:hypothetical protein